MKIKNWFFFFSEDHKAKIDQLRNENTESLKTWGVFTVILPLLPFFFSVFIHFLIYGAQDWTKMLTGSIPIISFGIVCSGITFLMEKLEIKGDDELIMQIKKRIMAVAVSMLFLTASLFIFENLAERLFNNSCPLIFQAQYSILLMLSLFCLCLSARIGQNMFLVQKQLVEKNYGNQVLEETDSKHGKTWGDNI
jgi:hypothetical protein